MRLYIYAMFFLVSLLSAQTDSTKWRQYGRFGMVSVDSTNGAFGFYRLNRTTDIKYNDLNRGTAVNRLCIADQIGDKV